MAVTAPDPDRIDPKVLKSALILIVGARKPRWTRHIPPR
jgi:hypothetical protein